MTVSILCLAHNHGPYIRDALEGFVTQEAPFPFEVLVHDDASTDGTAGVIREYAAAYPSIIRPVFQTQNQHSRGVNVTREFLWPLIRGRYVALCEGDDCWTDSRKLARQVAALEAHPELDICTHRVLKMKNGRAAGFEGPRRGGVYPAEKVILGGGGFVATSSILCRRECYLQTPPFREALFLDYSLQILGSLRGGLLHLPECMGVYRRGVPGSFSMQYHGVRNTDYYPDLFRMLELLDRDTGGRYASVIRRRTARYRMYYSFRQWQKRWISK